MFSTSQKGRLVDRSHMTDTVTAVDVITEMHGPQLMATWISDQGTVRCMMLLKMSVNALRLDILLCCSIIMQINFMLG
jgi:hypothetical protein